MTDTWIYWTNKSGTQYRYRQLGLRVLVQEANESNEWYDVGVYKDEDDMKEDLEIQ